MTDTKKLAQELLGAYKHRPIPPLTRTYPGLTLDDAYAVQLEQVAAWASSGRRLVGHKIGLTSLAMQRMLGVDEPDYGHLFADMESRQDEPIAVARFIAPRVEPEIGFILGSDLTGAHVTADDALAAVRWVIPTLEIVDSRIANWEITLEDTIADNASSAGFVVGDTRLAPTDIDLTTIHCRMSVDGQLVGEGSGADVMGSPIEALAWLARTLAPRGVVLRAGDVVLPGAVCGMVPASAGTTIRAEFSGLGEVSAAFV